MRAITLCPACQTQFFVTAAQLEKHHGKVRCGECDHVFLATDHFIASENAETTAVAVKSEPLHHNHDSANTGTLGDYVPESKSRSWFSAKLSSQRKPNPKWLMYLIWFACVLLILSAIAQTIYVYRTTIASHYPSTASYLKQMCVPLKCTIDLPKNIAFIAIDDSDIQEDADFLGALRFTSTLQNLADFRQAYPNIELTLTDLDDQPLLRRVFKPIDYLPPSRNIDDGLAAQEAITLNLSMLAKDVVVSGYRVSVNY